MYHSNRDDCVATIRANRAQNLAGRKYDTNFIRVLGEKEYELNDHLGNVRARFSDLKRTASAPFSADQRGYTNYLPYEMAE